MISSVEGGDGCLIIRRAMAHIESRDMTTDIGMWDPLPRSDKSRYPLTMRELLDVSDILVAAYTRVTETRAKLELVRGR